MFVMIIECKELGLSMTADQVEAAVRFNACVDDGQDHDVSRELMAELAELGLVEQVSEGYYSQTDLMIRAKEFLSGFASEMTQPLRRPVVAKPVAEVISFPGSTKNRNEG